MDTMRRKVAGEIPYIPPEIMIQILMLLRFQDILACRIASKEWKDIISHPSFFSRNYEKPLALFTSENTFYCILAIKDKKFDNLKLMEYRIPIIDSKLSFENSSHFMASNGMTCLEDRNTDFVLYNFFSGASSVVKNTVLGEWAEYSWYNGFGYDAYEDDYKIFVTNGFMGKNGPFWVYSVRNHEWESFIGRPRFPYDHNLPYNNTRQPDRRACFSNGALHWIVRSSYICCKPVLLAYDLHTREFHEKTFPIKGLINRSGSHEYDSDGLVQMRGLLWYWRKKEVYQVWVLKDYQVNESWALVFKVKTSSISPNMTGRYDLIEPIMWGATGGKRGIIFVCPNLYGWLYIYDYKNGLVTDMQKKRVRVGGRLLGTVPT